MTEPRTIKYWVFCDACLGAGYETELDRLFFNRCVECGGDGGWWESELDDDEIDAAVDFDGSIVYRIIASDGAEGASDE